MNYSYVRMYEIPWDHYLLAALVAVISILYPVLMLRRFIWEDDRNWQKIKASVIGSKSYSSPFLDTFHQMKFRGTPLINYSGGTKTGFRHYKIIEYRVDGKIYQKELYMNPVKENIGTGGSITIEYNRKNPYYIRGIGSRLGRERKQRRQRQRKLDFFLSGLIVLGTDLLLWAFIYAIIT